MTEERKPRRPRITLPDWLNAAITKEHERTSVPINKLREAVVAGVFPRCDDPQAFVWEKYLDSIGSGQELSLTPTAGPKGAEKAA